MPPTSSRVLVALSGGDGGQQLLERARSLAGEGGALLAIHVSRGGGNASSDAREELRLLVEALGGSWHTVLGGARADTISAFARQHAIDQIVLGGTGGALARTLVGEGHEVHVVPRSGEAVGRDARVGRRQLLGLSRARQASGFGLAALLLAGGTPLLVTLRGTGSVANELLGYLLGIVVVALVGGLLPAVTAAVLASLAADWWLIPPLHQLSVSNSQESVALGVFVAVAVLVSGVVSLAATRTREAARAAIEAETLSALAGSVLRGEQALAALLGRVRESFSGSAVRLLERSNGGWTELASSPQTAAALGFSPTLVPLGETLRLELTSAPLSAADHRLLVAFAAHAAVLLEQRRLAEVEARVEQATEIDRVRTALLGAVSHDLRNPLAAAKTAVNGLLDPAVPWQAEQRHELLRTADESLDSLTRLVDDLLDLSRLQAGVLPLQLEPLFLDELVQVVALDAVVELGESLPPVIADAVLLERVLANLVQNSLRHSGDKPAVTATATATLVELDVVDHGPGIPPDRRAVAFEPFQRLGDRPARDVTGVGAGVGLGLAIARGLTVAMGGTLDASETPGGGLTMTVRLPIARMSP